MEEEELYSSHLSLYSPLLSSSNIPYMSCPATPHVMG